MESALAKIWVEVLRLEQLAFMITSAPGGDRSSVFKSSPEQSLQAYSAQPVQYPTIAELSQGLCRICLRASSLVRSAPLSPIQHWFFLSKISPPTITGIRLSCLRSSRCYGVVSSSASIQHHSPPFHPTDAGYQRSFANPAGAALVTHVDLADLPPSDQVSAYSSGVAQTSLNISTGPS